MTEFIEVKIHGGRSLIRVDDIRELRIVPDGVWLSIGRGWQNTTSDFDELASAIKSATEDADSRPADSDEQTKMLRMLIRKVTRLEAQLREPATIPYRFNRLEETRQKADELRERTALGKPKTFTYSSLDKWMSSPTGLGFLYGFVSAFVALAIAIVLWLLTH